MADRPSDSGPSSVHENGCCLDHVPEDDGCMTAAEMRDEIRLQRWEEERDDHLAR